MIRKRELKEDGPSRRNLDSLWKKLWKGNVHAWIHTFLWIFAKNLLPTKWNLSKKGLTIDTSCSLCHNECETRLHLFLSCPFAQVVWFSSFLGIHISANPDPCKWLEVWVDKQDCYSTQLVCTILWKIWKFRNDYVFSNAKVMPTDVGSVTHHIYFQLFNLI